MSKLPEFCLRRTVNRHTYLRVRVQFGAVSQEKSIFDAVSIPIIQSETGKRVNRVQMSAHVFAKDRYVQFAASVMTIKRLRFFIVQTSRDCVSDGPPGSECKNRIHLGECLLSCPVGLYGAADNKTCLPCNSSCEINPNPPTGLPIGCTGPKAVQGPGGCDRCQKIWDPEAVSNTKLWWPYFLFFFF